MRVRILQPFAEFIQKAWLSHLLLAFVMLSFRHNFKHLISEIRVMESVCFINIDDDGFDVILSFSVYDSDPCDIESLILMRTPSYDTFLEDYGRGLSVSFKSIEDSFLSRFGTHSDLGCLFLFLQFIIYLYSNRCLI